MDRRVKQNNTPTPCGPWGPFWIASHILFRARPLPGRPLVGPTGYAITARWDNSDVGVVGVCVYKREMTSCLAVLFSAVLPSVERPAVRSRGRI